MSASAYSLWIQFAVLRRGAARRPGTDAGTRAGRRRVHPIDGYSGSPRRSVGRRTAGTARLRRRRFDTVLVETVGVGQSEVEIAGSADVQCCLLAPGMGDGIQAAKAGILEIGDIFVVNKSDRDGAQALVRELRIDDRPRRSGQAEWKPPIVTTVASKQHGRFPSCLGAVHRFQTQSSQSGRWDLKRLRRASDRGRVARPGQAASEFRIDGQAGLDELAKAVRRWRAGPVHRGGPGCSRVVADDPPTGRRGTSAHSFAFGVEMNEL